MRSYHRLVVLAGLVAVGTVVAAPARAHHNDWAAPLVGGALGGYALGTLAAYSAAHREHLLAGAGPRLLCPRADLRADAQRRIDRDPAEPAR